MLSRRWLAFVGAIWIMIVTGGGYNFGIYSEAIKESLGYTQNTVSTIAFFRDIGANLGIHCGILYSHAGARYVLLAGACFNLVGYLLIWLIVIHKVANPGAAVVSLLFFLLTNSQAFGFACGMITSVKSFPESRGVVIGVVTSFVGLSGAFLALVFEAIYGHETRQYLFFNAWFTSGAFVLLIPLMEVDGTRTSGRSSSKRMRHFSVFSFVTAGYMFVVIVLKVLVNVNRVVHITLTGVLVFHVIVIPCLILVMEKEDESPEESPVPNDNLENGSNGELQKQKLERGDDFTVWQAMTSLDMWIIFLANTCGLGTVLAALDNMGQVGTAWRYSTRQITNSVSFTSIWNFLGRIIAGWLSQVLLERYGIPRPLVFAMTFIVASAGHLFIALNPSSAALLLASAFEGFALGALFTLVFTMTSELFGLESFATLYSMGTSFSTILGTYLLSVLLAGDLFDEQSRKQHRARGICYGTACYRESFFVMTGVSFFGLGLSLLLAFRTRHFYKRLAQKIR